MAFGAPSEWCDRRCGRCVVEPRCHAAREETEWRRRHEERGEDPDVVEVIMADVAEALVRAFVLARDALAQQGHDPDAPIERPPPSALSASIHDASMCLVRAAQRLGEALPWIDGPLLSIVTRMAAKAARLATFAREGEPGLDEIVAGNACATVLLLERLDEQVAALEALGDGAHDVLEARARFWQSLEPVRLQVPNASRRHLAHLVDRGRAPSPFVIRRRATGRCP